jgi:hypothetical protein
MSGEYWSPVVSELVTEHVMRYRNDEAVLRRFFAKVDYGFSASDCHVWTGALSDEGYGVFALPREAGVKRVVRAHRVSWLWRYGPPPEVTPFLDHSTSCIGRFCVNLTHLEPVDNAENQRRRTNVGKAGQRFMRHAELVLRDERRAAGEPEVF